MSKSDKGAAIASQPAASVSASAQHAEAMTKAQAKAATSASTISASPAFSSSTNDGEDLADILAEEAMAISAMEDAIATHSLDSVPALNACIRTLESWIGLYKLAPMDALIEQIWEHCKKRYVPPKERYKTIVTAVSRAHATRSEKPSGEAGGVDGGKVGGAAPGATAEVGLAALFKAAALKAASAEQTPGSAAPDTDAAATAATADADATPEPEAGTGTTSAAPTGVVAAPAAAAEEEEDEDPMAGVDVDDAESVAQALARADLLDATEAQARRRTGGDLFVRVMQMKAFMRYKQFRFKESLALFYTFRDMVGPSPELLENMGHTHNTVGEPDKAVKCFQEALEVVALRADITPGYVASDHSGGLLLGLGVSLRRMGKVREGLGKMNEALAVYKGRFGSQDHSLVAKTLSGIADAHMQLGDVSAAIGARREAVRVFKATCGVSPLTANALFALHKALWARHLLSQSKAAGGKPGANPRAGAGSVNASEPGDVVESVAALDEALELHVGFDTLDVPEIFGILSSVVDVRSKLVGRPFPGPMDPVMTPQSGFKGYVPAVLAGVANMEAQGKHESEDAAVLYKAAGEVLVIAGERGPAKRCFQASKALLSKVTSVDVSGLLGAVETLIGFCDR
jgi:tetratricopeptide (TPR) repeat protein